MFGSHAGQAYDGTATVYLAKYLPSQCYVAVSRTNLDAIHDGFTVLQVRATLSADEGNRDPFKQEGVLGG